jgi:putative ABC transport system permease protein
MRAVPGVRDIGAGVVVPLTGNNWTVPFERTDRPVAPGARAPDVGWQVASAGFFRSLEIPLVSGRLFEAQDGPGAPPVAIVSRAVERRFFDGGSAVGGRIKLGDQTVEIVGVVGDIRRAGFNDEPRADLYLPFEQALNGQITLFVRTLDAPGKSLAAIRTAIRGIEPEAVIASPRTMEEVAHESVQVTRLVLWLLAAFAATALVLAAVGIYGVMSYVVGQRSKEIGTRIALGAAPRDILWLVLRQGARIAIAALHSLWCLVHRSGHSRLGRRGTARNGARGVLSAGAPGGRNGSGADAERGVDRAPSKGGHHAHALSPVRPGPRSRDGAVRISGISAPQPNRSGQ